MKTIKNLKSYWLILFIISHITVTAQTGTEQYSYLETRGAIGLVNLLRVSDGVDYSFPNLESASIVRNDLSFVSFSGFQFQAGISGLRPLGESLWLRSGLQYNYLQGKSNFLSENWFLIPPQEKINSFDWTRTVSFHGFQVPVQLEYHFAVNNLNPYINLGMAMGYSKATIDYSQEETSFYAFGISYNDECGWCEIVDLSQLDPPFNQENKGDYKQDQYQFFGLFGIGTLIKRPRDNMWRIGYQLSADLMALNQGNKPYENVYETYIIDGAEFHHLSHQIEFAYLWKTKKPFERINTDEKKVWKGIFAGLGVDVQLDITGGKQAGRSGTGWGNQVNLMYVSSIGLGARFARARWIAPSSRYGTESRIYKAEALYQLPVGIQFHSGLIRRTDGDSDGGGGGGWGVLAGTGALIPVHPSIGLHLQVTGQYFRPAEERVLIELGVGAVYRILK